MTDTRWLDAEEKHAWLSFLVATRLLWSSLERDLQREAGISLAYYEILSLLSEAPDQTLRLNRLADALQVSPSRLSHALSRLEDMGLVRRESCVSDRRGYLAVLTPKGMSTVEAVAPAHLHSVRANLFDQLDEEQVDQLRDISEALLRKLLPESDVALPPQLASLTLKTAGD
ncbi:MAG TPA: MarR family transcriptional regulator [Chloroflexota bacterium]|nr:MarR family transcriptional regulator [Chloroflexota bacterium]